MHVCFIALEYFGWGKYGGIGKATRDIATGLAQKKTKVSVVVPSGAGQSSHEYVDDVDVYGFPLSEYPFVGGILRRIDADIYHSQDPTLGTWLAKKRCGDAVHLLTCQNPKTSEDWAKVNQYYPKRRLIYNRLLDPLVVRCVKDLDRVYCHARYTIEKVKKLYGLEEEPVFLPNPVEVPKKVPKKSSFPTVLFLGRFDGEKNPEAFMQLAKKFPDVNFIAAGASHDPKLDDMIRAKYIDVKNLSLPGFVNGVEKKRILDDTWVLVNTSVSECLPLAFLEAAAHGCSILSPHDPDGFASGFGLHKSHEELCDGLTWLLEDEHWREKGIKGYRYVKENHEMNRVIDRHLSEYHQWVS